MTHLPRATTGEGGIRTHGAIARPPVFKTGTFSRSVTSPDVHAPVCALASPRNARVRVVGWALAGLRRDMQAPQALAQTSPRLAGAPPPRNVTRAGPPGGVAGSHVPALRIYPMGTTVTKEASGTLHAPDRSSRPYEALTKPSGAHQEAVVPASKTAPLRLRL